MFKRINLTPINTLYVCFIIVYTAIREVLPLNFLIDNNFVSAAIFGFGAVLIIFDLLVHAKSIRGKTQDLLILFIAVCIISSIINIKYGIFDNVKYIATLVIEYFVIFCFAAGDTKEQLSKKLDYTTATLNIVWFIVVFASLLMYFFNIDIVVLGRSVWGANSQGFSHEFSRLWGILLDPNSAGVTSVVVLFASVRFIAKNKNIIFRLFNVINIITQLFYITLGGSRAALILLFLSLAVFVGYRFIIKKENISSTDVAKGVFMTAISLFVCVVIFVGTKTAIPYIKTYAFADNSSLNTKATSIYTKLYSLSGYDFEINNGTQTDNTDDTDSNDETTSSSGEETTEFPSDEETTAPPSDEETTNSPSDEETTVPPETSSPSDPQDKPVDIIGRTDLNKADISNGRFKRWKHTFQVFLKAPLFGTSPRNLASFAKENNPETLMARFSSAPHNGYLDVLAETGIIGFCVLAVTFLLIMFTVVKNFFKKRYSPTRAFLLVSIITFAGIAVFISDIFMVFSINSTLFWLILGFAYNYDNQHKENGIIYFLYKKVTNKFKSNTISREE